MTDCIFCKIAAGEFGTEMVYETGDLVAFNDLNPQAPVHVLIVPKKHIRSINDLETADKPLVGEMFFAAKKIAEKLGIAESGYKLFFHVEEGGGQQVFHLHLHLIGGWE